MSLNTAIKTLKKYTTGYDIYALAGNHQAASRAHVMADLLGLPKVAQAKAGVTALRIEFYRQAGIQDDCERNREHAFIAYCEANHV